MLDAPAINVRRCAIRHEQSAKRVAKADEV
jgi:hypothetical protein